MIGHSALQFVIPTTQPMEPVTKTLCIQRIKKIVFGLIVYFVLVTAQGQTKRVLFLGNSYTSVNNLPKMVSDIASSVGDSLIFDSNAPGGYYLGDHFVSSVSVNKIKSSNWDYVVLQDQSQSHASQPGFYTFSKASHKLDSIIGEFNLCAQTLFYITWGRKNGAPYWDSNTNTPGTWTYYQMDSAIQLNYMLEADSLRALASPVGAVWRYIKRNYPAIELFDADGSHPSQAGTYAAACCFYTVLFRKTPSLIAFDTGLSAIDAANIRNAAKAVVYDNFLMWNIGKYDYLINNACLTSIHDLSDNSSVKIFPNPFYSQTTVEINTFFQNSTFTLINSFGHTVKRLENVSGQSITLFRDNLPSGLYFLRLTKGDNNYFSTSRLVITDN